MKSFNLLKKFLKDEQGLEPVEYALMLVLLALVAVGGALTLGTSISEKFTEVGETVDSGAPVPEL